MQTEDMMLLSRTRDMVASGKARELRLAAGLSLGDVAQTAGLSTSAVWRFENGQRVPRGAGAIRYGRVLAVLDREASHDAR